MLKYTGERIIPEIMKPTNPLLLEHLARYHFAAPYARGKVLDIACGTGYGTSLIAKLRKKHVSHVLGVDADQATTDYAHKYYYHPLLTFMTGNVLDNKLKEGIGVFDTVISFETLEHVPDDIEFIDRIYDLMAPGGTLILSTPFGEGRGIPCRSPFHCHQLAENEFCGLFSRPETPFREADIYFQNGVALEKEKREDVHYPIGIAVAVKSSLS